MKMKLIEMKIEEYVERVESEMCKQKLAKLKELWN
jgi:hypothetical protein